MSGKNLNGLTAIAVIVIIVAVICLFVSLSRATHIGDPASILNCRDSIKPRQITSIYLATLDDSVALNIVDAKEVWSQLKSLKPSPPYRSHKSYDLSIRINYKVDNKPQVLIFQGWYEKPSFKENERFNERLSGKGTPEIRQLAHSIFENKHT